MNIAMVNERRRVTTISSRRLPQMDGTFNFPRIIRNYSFHSSKQDMFNITNKNSNLALLTQHDWFLPTLQPIERHSYIGGFTMYNGKLGAYRFPSKRMDRFPDFFTIYGDVLLSHVEDFKIVVHTLFGQK